MADTPPRAPSIRDFAINSDAMQNGEWVNPGPEFGGIEIKTRSFVKEYTLYRSAKMRTAMRRAGVKTEEELDPDIRGEIAVQCFLDKMFIDVRNMNDDEGQPLTAESFRKLIWERNYRPYLFGAGIAAAAIVGQRMDDDVEDSSKN
jgi:hypothetical protein